MPLPDGPITAITETGLRVYKELICYKEQVDIANKVVFVIDSKTPTGVSELPLTDIATQAFQDQLQTAGPGHWLFKVRESLTSTSLVSRRFSKEPFSGPVCVTSESTICGRPTQLG